LVRDFEHRGFDGLENLKITCAPAQISGDRFADLLAAGVRIPIQQSLRRDQNRRCAITALRRAKIGKSILQGMKVSVFSKAFHSSASTRQESTGLPFRRTAQAPHSPSSQPCFVPV
jgi:hypothetical protein